MSLPLNPTVSAHTEKVLMLETWCEACGKVIEVIEEKHLIIFEGFLLRLPMMDLSFSKRVYGFLGQRVSILRTDLVTTPYRLNPLRRVAKNPTTKLLLNGVGPNERY